MNYQFLSAINNFMHCPICNIDNISYKDDKCPQCDSDLSCFKMLESLPDELPKFKQKNSEKNNYLILSLILLIVLFCAVIISQLNNLNSFEDSLSGSQDMISYKLSYIDTTMQEKMQSMISKIETAQQEIEALKLKTTEKLKKIDKLDKLDIISNIDIKPPQIPIQEEIPKQQHTITSAENKFYIYTALETDTLWRIAKKFYGSGFYFPIILEHNPDITIYTIGKGVKIKILKNPDLAKKTYKKSILLNNKKVYWNYLVNSGDTFESIAYKFYKSKEKANDIATLNLNSGLKPGNRIKVALDIKVSLKK